MRDHRVKSFTDFAEELGVARQTVADVVRLDALPTEKMQHGRAKGLSPQTQRQIMKRLGIKRGAAAS